MGNYEKYLNVFMEIFEISEEKAKTLEYQDIEQWDSVGHMGLIAEIEDTFDIMMDTDDIIDFNSFTKGMELLKKYDIVF
jgi:acyl carrier protein